MRGSGCDGCLEETAACAVGHSHPPHDHAAAGDEYASGRTVDDVSERRLGSCATRRRVHHGLAHAVWKHGCDAREDATSRLHHVRYVCVGLWHVWVFLLLWCVRQGRVPKLLFVALPCTSSLRPPCISRLRFVCVHDCAVSCVWVWVWVPGWWRGACISGVLCGSSWWRRHLFPDACGAAVWLFSRKFFKEHFLNPLITCTEDGVASVRRKAIACLPMLRLWMQFPKDAEAISRLITVATASTEDSNEVVASTAERVVDELRRVRVSVSVCVSVRLCACACVCTCTCSCVYVVCGRVSTHACVRWNVALAAVGIMP